MLSPSLKISESLPSRTKGAEVGGTVTLSHQALTRPLAATVPAFLGIDLISHKRVCSRRGPPSSGSSFHKAKP